MLMVLGPHKKKTEARAEAAAERDRRMAARAGRRRGRAAAQLADRRAQHAAGADGRSGGGDRPTTWTPTST